MPKKKEESMYEHNISLIEKYKKKKRKEKQKYQIGSIFKHYG